MALFLETSKSRTLIIDHVFRGIQSEVKWLLIERVY